MATSKKREQPILTRLFVHDNGHVGPRAGLDVNTVVFKYQDDKETRVELAQFFGGSLPAPGVGRAAAAFGIQTSAGNTVGTVERERDEAGKIIGDPHPDDVREAVEDRIATFLAGRWASEAGPGGPGTSSKMDTLIKFRTEVLKQPADDEWQAKVRAQLEEDENWWKTLLQDPQFRSVHATLQAERAAARAKAAAEKAAAAPKGGSTLQI